MAAPGTGAKSFLMMALEQQSATYNVGMPLVDDAANWNLVQFMIDPSTVYERNDTWTVPNELTGYLGNPVALPTRAAYPLDLSMSLRTGALTPILATFMGKPTRTQDGTDPAYQFVYAPTDAQASSVSLWGLFHKGGSTTPLIFHGAKFNDLQFDAGAAEVSLKAKGQGTGDTEHGIAATGVKTGTYAYCPILSGNRGDANRLTDTLTVKVSSAPTLGTFKLKVKLGAGSDSTTETTCTYDVSSKKMSGWTELVGDTGALGVDECDNREPLMIFFPGDVTLMALNDTYVFPALAQIPGNGSGESGVARTRLTGCRFGPAHVSIKRGSSSADTVLDCTALSVKLSRTITPFYSFGNNAKNPLDMDVVGYIGVELDIDRRFIDREFERLIRLNDRLVAQVKFEGATISGSTSLWRDSFWIDIPQCRIQSVNSPLGGPGVTAEKLVVMAEQKADGSDVLSATIRSGTDWDFSVI